MVGSDFSGAPHPSVLFTILKQQAASWSSVVQTHFYKVRDEMKHQFIKIVFSSYHCLPTRMKQGLC